VNQTPSYRAGDSLTASIVSSLTVTPWAAFNLNTSYTKTAKNEALDSATTLFFIQIGNANSDLFKIELGETSTIDAWSFGPYAGYVDRKQNTFNPLDFSFVPAKTIEYLGAKVKYDATKNLSFKADVQRFTSKINESPDKSSGGILIAGSGYPTLFFNGWKTSLDMTYRF
jgi:hypothetical protein